MEKTPKLRSIFDILENFHDEVFRFKWTHNIPIIPPKKKHLIDGNLMKKSKKGNLKLRWFVLLPSGLVKFRKHSQTVAVAFLPFRNPRVRKLENKEQRLVGFRLKAFGEQYEFWMSELDKWKDWMEKLSSICVLHNLSNRYSIGKQIGRGNFAKVHLLERKEDKKKFALKSIDKSKIFGNKLVLEATGREIMVLRKANHPNILKMYEVYENQLYIHLVLEYLEGGELLGRLKKSETKYSENDAAAIMNQLLLGLEYLHSIKVVHRDLKPDNILYSHKSPDETLKIVDFGLSTICTPNEPETLRCGSPGFVAPEILRNEGYGAKADVFSTGVIFCLLLTGDIPFKGQDPMQVLIENERAFVNYDLPCWKKISESAKDLIKQMLHPDPNERISASSALIHHWFMSEKTSVSLQEVSDNIKKYSCHHFDLSKIKPEFSLVTNSQLLALKRQSPSSANSPLILSNRSGSSGIGSSSQFSSRCFSKVLSGSKLKISSSIAASPSRKLSSFSVTAKVNDENDNGDFDESETEENAEINTLYLTQTRKRIQDPSEDTFRSSAREMESSSSQSHEQHQIHEEQKMPRLFIPAVLSSISEVYETARSHCDSSAVDPLETSKNKITSIESEQIDRISCKLAIQ